MKKLKQARAKTQKYFVGAIALIIVIMCFASTPTVKSGTVATASTSAIFMGGLGLAKLSPDDATTGGGEAREKVLKEMKDVGEKAAKEAVELAIKQLKDDNPKLFKELATYQERLEKAATAEEVKKLSEAINDVGKDIEAWKEKGRTVNTIKSKVFDFIQKNKQQISDNYKAGKGFVELELKAVDYMTTASATNPDGIPELVGVQMAPPTNVNLRDNIVDALVTNFSTSLAAYPYTESIPKDGDFSFIGERQVKPEIDFEIETRYATPYKVAAWIGLSEESVQDIPGLQSIATDYLFKKHQLKKQRGILFGTNTSKIPKGATVYGRSFVAGSMATSVRFANFMDVVNAAITDIYTTPNYQDEMPYMANLAMINPVQFFTELVAAKDEFGHPLYPMASLMNRVTIGGVTIIPDMMIPDGKILVADMTKYNVSNYLPYIVKIGWINDDFIKNQFVILGESRFHAYVKKLDEIAFIYDDIDTIKAAISTAS